jgi:hypothetical protein
MSSTDTTDFRLSRGVTDNFGIPSSTVGSPTFGRLTSAFPGRDIQLGVKFLF